VGRGKATISTGAILALKIIYNDVCYYFFSNKYHNIVYSLLGVYGVPKVPYSSTVK